jgi:thioredoxin reductase (NADPH)
MTSETTENVIIIGSGPAAMTAAIYAARAELSPLLIEGEVTGTMMPGGQLMITTEVENFPGFPDGITGPELVDRMRAQAQRFGTRSLNDHVERVDLSKRPFTVWPRYGTPLQAETLIIATGSNARWLGVPGEEALARGGGGVSACAICDGALPIYRNKILAVIGGGDSACEEATFLARYASEVILIHRRDSLRASRIMAERVLSNPKIRVLWDTRVVEVSGEREIESLLLENLASGAQSRLAVGGMFVAIGHEPNTAFLQGQLRLTSSGCIWTEPGLTRTSVPGVFAAGDVMDDVGTFRQAITASGFGCAAGLEAARFLAGHG